MSMSDSCFLEVFLSRRCLGPLLPFVRRPESQEALVKELGIE